MRSQIKSLATSINAELNDALKTASKIQNIGSSTSATRGVSAQNAEVKALNASYAQLKSTLTEIRQLETRRAKLDPNDPLNAKSIQNYEARIQKATAEFNKIYNQMSKSDAGNKMLGDDKRVQLTSQVLKNEEAIKQARIDADKQAQIAYQKREQADIKALQRAEKMSADIGNALRNWTKAEERDPVRYQQMKDIQTELNAAVTNKDAAAVEGLASRWQHVSSVIKEAGNAQMSFSSIVEVICFAYREICMTTTQQLL